jgi:hypothetical protein
MVQKLSPVGLHGSLLPIQRNNFWNICSLLVLFDICHSASHKSNPSFVPQGIVDSYSTLPWVMWEAVTVVEGIPWWGLLQHILANGAQAKVEGILVKAAWHWGRDSSVENDPLGEPGHTPLYVGLPSTWGSVDGDQIFSPLFVGGLLIGDSHRYKWMNKP